MLEHHILRMVAISPMIHSFGYGYIQINYIITYKVVQGPCPKPQFGKLHQLTALFGKYVFKVIFRVNIQLAKTTNGCYIRIPPMYHMVSYNVVIEVRKPTRT